MIRVAPHSWVAAAWLACAAALAAEPVAKLVPAESQIAFVSKQMGVPVEGVFKKFDAQIALNPAKPENGTVALQIDMASASFGAPQADAELPTAPWFDVKHFPQASFRSESIKNQGYGRLEVTGKLTIKGQARQVVVPVAITQAEGKSVASGTFAVRRLEFRVGDGDWTDTSMVADEVQVRFKLTLMGLGAP
jgi:polyisoprenoid-binding protein YceI